MHKPLTIVAKFIAKPDAADFVQAEIEKLLAPTRAEPGCINYDLHQDNRTPEQFLIYENWDTYELWQDHMNAPHLKAFQDAIDGKLEDLTIWEMTRIG